MYIHTIYVDKDKTHIRGIEVREGAPHNPLFLCNYHKPSLSDIVFFIHDWSIFVGVTRMRL